MSHNYPSPPSKTFNDRVIKWPYEIVIRVIQGIIKATHPLTAFPESEVFLQKFYLHEIFVLVLQYVCKTSANVCSTIIILCRSKVMGGGGF